MEVNEIEKNLSIEKNTINETSQKNFLETTLGKTINTALDIGIRALLPDFIDEQIINLKNNLFNNGLKEGITKTIDDAIDIGKSAIGIVTGNFENVNQMQAAVKTGGIIDGISNLLDTVVNKAQNSGLINYNIANTIKNGKNVILNSVESNIENTFSSQLKSVEIQKSIKNLAPIEKTINEARTVENLHNLIKNNGKNFDLTQEELELAEKLK